MISWTCPNCKTTYYSAWERRGEETVGCDNCGADIVNPYYEIPKRSAKEKGVQMKHTLKDLLFTLNVCMQCLPVDTHLVHFDRLREIGRIISEPARWWEDRYYADHTVPD